MVAVSEVVWYARDRFVSTSPEPGNPLAMLVANCDSAETAAEIVALRERLDRALEMLATFEWQYDEEFSGVACDVCDARFKSEPFVEQPKHKPGCELAALFAECGA